MGLLPFEQVLVANCNTGQRGETYILVGPRGDGQIQLNGAMARLAQRGELYQVVKDLYYPVVTMAQLAAICRQVASHNGGTVVAAGFRDATRLGRKRAIQILEHFDRIGLLRRVGDTHWLREDSLLFREAPL